MFKKLAQIGRFQRHATPSRRLFQPPWVVRALRPAIPANDNQPTITRPRRLRGKPLACRWLPIDGGMRLVARWEVESQPRSVIEGADFERLSERRSRRKPTGLAVAASRAHSA